MDLSFGRYGLTATLPPPPEGLRGDKPVAVIDLTDAFDLDTGANVLGVDPKRVVVRWMSWEEWWKMTDRQG